MEEKEIKILVAKEFIKYWNEKLEIEQRLIPLSDNKRFFLLGVYIGFLFTLLIVFLIMVITYF